MAHRTLTLRSESWPIAGRFTIARGSKTEANVIVAEVRDGDFAGRGECVPYARYGEGIASVLDAIETVRGDIEAGATAAHLQKLLPAGAARNALDCALIDLEAKTKGIPAATLLGLPATGPAVTAYTISLDAPEAMARHAARLRELPLLKVKLGGDGDADRIAAVREAAPTSEIVVDANESWSEELLMPLTAACLAAGVKLIEQPMAQGKDEALRGFMSPVPLCADESCHTRADLPELIGKYQAVNVKLDKAGGLTEAVALAKEARAANLSVMIGCMIATSLATAPALLLAPLADFIDLDGPALLARDRPHGLSYENGRVFPAGRELWG